MKNYRNKNANPKPILLLNSPPLVIIPELACLIGLNEAVVLQQVHYWELANSREGINFKDGHYWTYNSYPKWQKQFPFWSVDTIQRIFRSLEKKELIISGNYNKMKIDRTKWYRVNREGLDALLSISGIGNRSLQSPIPQSAVMDTESLDG